MAGDAAGAWASARLFLRRGSLFEYYDEVVMEGLRLASADDQAGNLGHAQLGRLQQLSGNLIQDLSTYVDRRLAVDQPGRQRVTKARLGRQNRRGGIRPVGGSHDDAHQSGPALVLCVPGGGPFDEAASAMLVQLVRRHGIPAQLASQQCCIRDGGEATLGSTVALICLTYLDAIGDTVFLRQCVRQVREGVSPSTPVLIMTGTTGKWPSQEAVSKADTEADYLASLLEQAVTACAMVRPASNSITRCGDPPK